jgi:autophagy-related protein 18
VAVLDARVHVHALQTLGQLRIIETPQNPKGLAALTPCSEPCCYLALPASAAAGVLRVYDLLTDGGHVVCEVQVRIQTRLDSCSGWLWTSWLLA